MRLPSRGSHTKPRPSATTTGVSFLRLPEESLALQAARACGADDDDAIPCQQENRSSRRAPTNASKASHIHAARATSRAFAAASAACGLYRRSRSMVGSERSTGNRLFREPKSASLRFREGPMQSPVVSRRPPIRLWRSGAVSSPGVRTRRRSRLWPQRTARPESSVGSASFSRYVRLPTSVEHSVQQRATAGRGLDCCNRLFHGW